MLTSYGLAIKVCCLFQAMLSRILLRARADHHLAEKDHAKFIGLKLKAYLFKLREQFLVRSGGPKGIPSNLARK